MGGWVGGIRRGGGQVRSVGGSSLRRGVRTITLSKPLVVRPSHWHRHWHHHRHHHRIYPRVTHTHIPRPPSITIYLSLFLSPSPVSLAFRSCVYPYPVPSFAHLHVLPPCPVHTRGCNAGRTILFVCFQPVCTHIRRHAISGLGMRERAYPRQCLRWTEDQACFFGKCHRGTRTLSRTTIGAVVLLSALFGRFQPLPNTVVTLCSVGFVYQTRRSLLFRKIW